jgi:hypothetical protein
MLCIASSQRDDASKAQKETGTDPRINRTALGNKDKKLHCKIHLAYHNQPDLVQK